MMVGIFFMPDSAKMRIFAVLTIVNLITYE